MIIMDRLTNKIVAEVLKNNIEGLKRKGTDVPISDLRYVKLAEYENAEEKNNSMIDKLDGGYIRGFTKGLQKAQEIIMCIESDMKAHKRRVNVKSLIKIFNVAIKDREKLRENQEAFVRCIGDNDYEVYEPNKRRDLLYEKTQ